MTVPIVSTRDLTIRFGGHAAVDRVSLDIAPCTLKSIIGPNGAGKTTLFNLLSGQYRPTAGRVWFKGEDVTRLGAAARARRGIGRSFQLTNIFPTLTVLENVRIAVQARRLPGLRAWRDARRFPELEDRAYAILESVLLDTKWAAPASALAHGEKRKLEVGILLALEPEVLLRYGRKLLASPRWLQREVKHGGLDDDRLAELRAEILGQRPRHDVGRARRRERVSQGRLLRGPGGYPGFRGERNFVGRFHPGKRHFHLQR